ncbi:CMGC family protein kinase [Tritrichomonas foetus]|uniref:non-specific serine/threonine protein kinase n=1 Tax=Tritrichomonas foetus TaxID=1144522 RepID=A0A1J4KJX6_9EUKA|nr:CMGC family protein kinase [Tritrichomonas foetus]|eukprot:OHT11531.1 CMGC family protein kinase [Tritrichomonas foetus]
MRSCSIYQNMIQEPMNASNQFDGDEDIFSHELGNIEDYSVSTRLGRGKYSNVFRGRQKNGELCVVKVLKPVRIGKIMREITILEALKNGPNISQLREVVRDEDTGSIALILSWAENENIRSVFNRLTTNDIAIYIYRVLQALEYAHAHNIMHRDVKPGNIMFDPDTKEVSLIDWGLAEFYSPGLEYQVRVATRHYKGPELLLNYTKYDTSLDIWCLGVTLATLLFRKIPFFRGHDNDEQIVKLASVLGAADIYSYCDKYSLSLPTKVASEISGCQRKSWSNWINKNNKDVVTNEALHLLDKMLIIDHELRPTAKELLGHPFFNNVRDQ